MSGSMGRRPAQGTTLLVSTAGKSWRVQSISGFTRSARMSRFSPLNSAVPATRNRSWAEAARHDLGLVVEQAHPGGGAAALALQVDRDGIALHGIDVDPVAEALGQLAAGEAGADHDAVDRHGLGRAGRRAMHVGRGPAHRVALGRVAGGGGLHRRHVGIVDELGAAPQAGRREAAGEAVDVAGRVGFGEEAAVIGAVQGRLDRLHLGRRDAAAVEAALAQQPVDVGRRGRSRPCCGRRAGCRAARGRSRWSRAPRSRTGAGGPRWRAWWWRPCWPRNAGCWRRIRPARNICARRGGG